MLLSKSINKAASFLGIEIRRKKKPPTSNLTSHPRFNSSIPDEGSVVPRANFETISLVMQYFSKSEQKATVIQVGANDGVTSDSICNFIKTGRFNSCHIEPIPSTYKKLVKFYSQVDGAHTVNAAISERTGSVEIFSVINRGRWLDDPWATQLASFDRSHLLRHGISEDEIESVTVSSITFKDLIRDQGFSDIDVLVVDVEGFDAELVSMAIDSGILPKCIYFEYVQFVRRLTQSQVDKFYDLLSKSGYTWSHDRINTLALHSSFIRSGTPATPKIES